LLTLLALLEYDKEKCKEMIFDAAETVLGISGLERSIYENTRKKGSSNRKWR
jgi:hypothetical protein